MINLFPNQFTLKVYKPNFLNIGLDKNNHFFPKISKMLKYIKQI